MKNGIVPAVVRDENRNEYIDGLKEYREEKRANKLTELLKNEQKFYYDKCRYFM